MRQFVLISVDQAGYRRIPPLNRRTVRTEGMRTAALSGYGDVSIAIAAETSARWATNLRNPPSPREIPPANRPGSQEARIHHRKVNVEDAECRPIGRNVAERRVAPSRLSGRLTAARGFPPTNSRHGFVRVRLRVSFFCVGWGCPVVSVVSLAFNLVCSRLCWLRLFRLVRFCVWCLSWSFLRGHKASGAKSTVAANAGAAGKGGGENRGGGKSRRRQARERKARRRQTRRRISTARKSTGREARGRPKESFDDEFAVARPLS